MTAMIFICGAIGIVLYAAFAGFMLWWVPALPLIIIFVGVTVLMIYDFVMTVRHGENYHQR